MEIKKAELLSVLKRCMPGVETGNTLLEGADTFVFADGRVYTYNDNISVQVNFNPGEVINGAVKAKEFFRLVSKLSGEDIKLVEKDGTWVLKSGEAKAELALLDGAIMGRVKGLAADLAWKPIPGGFAEALVQCRFGCNRSALSGIYVNGGVMVSTDEMRINWYQLDGDMEAFWISAPAGGELTKLVGLSEYGLTDGWAHFKAEDGTIFSAKRLQDSKFPFEKIKAVKAAHAQAPEDISAEIPARLLEAVDRALSLSMDMYSYDAVRLTFSTEGVEVFAKRSTGKFNEKVAWDGPVDKKFDPVAVLVDGDMINQGVKRSKHFYLKQTTKGEKTVTRLVFTGERMMHLVSTFSAAAE